MSRHLTLRFKPYKSKNGVWEGVKIFGYRTGKRIYPINHTSCDTLWITTPEFKFAIVGHNVKEVKE